MNWLIRRNNTNSVHHPTLVQLRTLSLFILNCPTLFSLSHLHFKSNEKEILMYTNDWRRSIRWGQEGHSSQFKGWNFKKKILMLLLPSKKPWLPVNPSPRNKTQGVHQHTASVLSPATSALLLTYFVFGSRCDELFNSFQPFHLVAQWGERRHSVCLSSRSPSYH